MTMTPSVGRRRFVQGLALAGAGAAIGAVPAHAMRHGLASAGPAGPGELSGDRFDLAIGEMPFNVTGRARIATAVNGSVPAPILRWREGDTVTLSVTNKLMEPTSIHWHGIRSPANMDGVPGLSFRGIMPGETFTYRIPLKQAGTYWYHSHSGMQEQTGLYGAIVVAPKGADPHPYDREHVILLSDWTDEDPMTVVSNLKQEGDYYNYHQRTLCTLAGDIKQKGFTPAIREAAMWWKMRMTPTDLEDVSGATYTYLLNGRAPAANWAGLFKPGERVRLRFINGSSMTLFDVRIPGLTMNVVQTDGYDVVPVPVDEFRIGVAETYDVIVTPTEDRAYTVFAQSLGRMGYARATLAPRADMSAPIPAMDPVPKRTMKDMGMGDMQMSGMDMGGMNDGSGAQGMAGMPGMAQGGSKPMPGMEHGQTVARPAGGSMAGMPGMANPAKPAGEMAGMAGMSGMGHGSMPGMDHAAMAGMAMAGMAGMRAAPSSPATMGAMPGMAPSAPAAPKPAMGAMEDMGPMKAADRGSMTQMRMASDPVDLAHNNADGVDPKSIRGRVAVDNVAMDPVNRLGEAGDGLDGNGRRVLVYTDLKALTPGPDQREPTRDVVFHLTGNMQRWTWGFDGKKFAQSEPIHLTLGERVRFVLINDTMMEHPIHLHGLFSEIENGHGVHSPLKHTVTVKPGEKMSYLVSADTPGHWAFHCHLLYHMETGMFRTVVVS